jgi:hypothetical protein
LRLALQKLIGDIGHLHKIFFERRLFDFWFRKSFKKDSPVLFLRGNAVTTGARFEFADQFFINVSDQELWHLLSMIALLVFV